MLRCIPSCRFPKPFTCHVSKMCLYSKDAPQNLSVKLYVSSVEFFHRYNSNEQYVNILFFFQVTRVHEEFFLPGELIMEQGNVVDQLYIVCHGLLVGFLHNLLNTSLIIAYSFFLMLVDSFYDFYPIAGHFTCSYI